MARATELSAVARTARYRRALSHSGRDREFSVETRNVAPEHLLVRIESFSSLSANGIEKYESREFVAGDHKWKLTIRPNVENTSIHGVSRSCSSVSVSYSSMDWVSVDLSCVETDSLSVDWEVNAMFTFFLYNQVLDHYVCFRGKKMRRFHAMNPKWEFSKLISSRVFNDRSNGFLANDKCVFGAEVFVIKSPRVIERVSLLKSPPIYKHALVVSNFSKVEHVWNSQEFTAGDRLWKVKLFPNGNGSAKGRCVSLYIEYIDCERCAPHEKVMASICMCIKSNKNTLLSRNFSEWFSSTTSNVGFPEFMRIDDLQDPERGYVVDDICSLEIEISILVVVCDAPN